MRRTCVFRCFDALECPKNVSKHAAGCFQVSIFGLDPISPISVPQCLSWPTCVQWLRLGASLIELPGPQSRWSSGVSLPQPWLAGPRENWPAGYWGVAIFIPLSPTKAASISTSIFYRPSTNRPDLFGDGVAQRNTDGRSREDMYPQTLRIAEAVIGALHFREHDLPLAVTTGRLCSP